MTSLVLGIETSCDETAAAVVRRDGAGRGTILSNIVRSQIEEHRAFGGVVPELAARAHVVHLDHIIKTALDQAGVGFDDLSAIAATAVFGRFAHQRLAVSFVLPFLAGCVLAVIGSHQWLGAARRARAPTGAQ